MAYTDTAITAYVFPQDGGTGTTDSNADWTNAAYIGGLARATAVNYAPSGFGITADWANNQFELGGGIAYIQDDRSVTFRTPSDNEENRSGTWDLGYLAFLMMPSSATGIGLQNTSGMNWVWVYYTQSGQNDTYVRVANTDGDAPSGGLLIATLDASNQLTTERNRVAGMGWTLCGFDNFTSLQASVQTVPAVAMQDMILKMYQVYGDSTSSVQLYMTVNGQASGYDYRTTQGNVGGDTKVQVAHTIPTDSRINGQILFNGQCPNNVWAFNNEPAGATSKYVAFYGNNDTLSDTVINSAEFEWSAGNIAGYFEWWGRNYVGY